MTSDTAMLWLAQTRETILSAESTLSRIEYRNRQSALTQSEIDEFTGLLDLAKAKLATIRKAAFHGTLTYH